MPRPGKLPADPGLHPRGVPTLWGPTYPLLGGNWTRVPEAEAASPSAQALILPLWFCKHHVHTSTVTSARGSGLPHVRALPLATRLPLGLLTKRAVLLMAVRDSLSSQALLLLLFWLENGWFVLSVFFS